MVGDGITLHALEGKSPFGQGTLDVIGDLRKVYGLSLTAADSHRMSEAVASDPPADRLTR